MNIYRITLSDAVGQTEVKYYKIEKLCKGRIFPRREWWDLISSKVGCKRVMHFSKPEGAQSYINSIDKSQKTIYLKIEE